MNHYLSPMQPCANCNNPFESAYCPACGQKRVHAGIQLKEVITDFASGLFNVDAPILRTLREFIVAPGQMTRAWLAGKKGSASSTAFIISGSGSPTLTPPMA